MDESLIQNKPIRKRYYAEKWLAINGIGSIVAIYYPGYLGFLAFIIIGLPLAIALIFFPFIFVFSVCIYAAHRILRIGFAGYLVGFLMALAALVIPPVFLNATTEQRVAALMADDHNDLRAPLRADVLAFQRNIDDSRYIRLERCDEFCMRLLLNGQVKQVLFIKRDAPWPLDTAQRVSSFRLERRALCPKVALSSDDSLADQSHGISNYRTWASVRMVLEIASGNCLIKEIVPLSIADAIVSVRTVHSGHQSSKRVLDATVDTIQAERLSLHLRGTGGLQESSRWTRVTAQLLTPILFPTSPLAGMANSRGSFLRSEQQYNFEGEHQGNLIWKRFLTNRLGLELALADADQASRTRQVLHAALMTGAPLNDAAVQLGTAFLKELSVSKHADRQNFDANDLKITRMLLINSSFPITQEASDWISLAAGTGADEGFFETIVVSMFQRLASFPAADVGLQNLAWYPEALNIGHVLSKMPAATVLGHREQYTWLARQKHLRNAASSALYRLQEFGIEMVPTFLSLMDDSARMAVKEDAHWNTFQASLIGLCRMGSAGKDVVPAIYKRLDLGQFPKQFARLTIKTLLALGADPDQMWPHVQPIADGTKRYFDQVIDVERRKLAEFGCGSH